MNKTNFTQIKKFYENALTERLAEVLSLDRSKIIVNWDIEETVARVDLTNFNIVGTYTFKFDYNNLVVEMDSYKLLYDNNGAQVVGIQSQPITLDYQTMGGLFNIFKQVLEQDYVEPATTPAAEETND